MSEVDWKQKRVFVTGASGLVGSWLVDELVRQGAYVVCLVRDSDPQSELFRSKNSEKVSIISGRLEEYSDLQRALLEHEIDTVFHLGAQAIVNTALHAPLLTFESNIRGTYLLLEACRVSPYIKSVIVASSDKAYGSSPVLPYTEQMPVEGRHPYDVSKSCSDLLAKTYFKTYNLPVVIARCGNIYGGGDLNWSRIFPSVIRSFYLEKSPIIRSDGKFTRDYVFVKDVAKAYMLLAEHTHRAEVAGEAFNFGPNSPMTVLEVVSAIAKVMGKEHIEPTILNQAKSEIKDQYLASEKAHQTLGWQQAYSFDEGLLQTVDWYVKYFEKTGLQSPKLASV